MNNWINAMKQINLIKNEAGKIKKENIIKTNISNELFKKIMFYVFNDKKYGLKLTEIIDTNQHTREFTDLFELLDYCAETNTNNDLRANVNFFLKSSPVELQAFFMSIINKDMKIGLGAKTINKYFEEVTNWEVQQGSPQSKLSLKKDEWICLEHKLNGVRATYYNGNLISRNGKVIAVDKILLDTIKTSIKDGYIADGELVYHNDELTDNENFLKTIALTNSLSTDTEDLKYVIFDTFPQSEFDVGESIKTYKDRLVDIREIVENDRVKIVNVDYEGTDHSKVIEVGNKYTKLGLEGAMCYKNCKYQRKRHTGLIKIKEFKMIDLQVVDLLSGEVGSKYENCLGSFVVEFNGNTVQVGSGITDQERLSFWKEKDSLIGRFIEVKYKEITKDSKTKLESLQFPTFVNLK